MIDQSLDDLRRLTEARFQAEQAEIHDVIAEESRVRQSIANLEAQHTKALDAQRGALHGQGQIGGDVLWQGWVSRNRRALQIQLAQVLARKAQRLRALNLAHGRKLASQTLYEKSGSIQEKLQRSKEFEQEQTLVLLKAMARSNRQG